MPKFAIVVTLLIAFSAFAFTGVASADCEPARLDLENGSMAQVPVETQDSEEICYAVIASPMTTSTD